MEYLADRPAGGRNIGLAPEFYAGTSRIEPA
jgi:hypothetical protein